MIVARCTMCGEWSICSSNPAPDVQTFRCAECRYAIAEAAGWYGDDGITEIAERELPIDEQPTLILSAQHAQPLNVEPAPDERPADEWSGCEYEPEPGRTYCALSYLVFRENSDAFPVVPEGQPVICDAHYARLFEQFTAKYDGIVQPNIIAGITATFAQRYINAALAQAERIATRYRL